VATVADLDPVLREVVRCPVCRGPLDDAEDALVCRACALVYPVRDGVPVLLRDDAVPLDSPNDEEQR
jgi:uncharacterized protein YbaR (Trm112 family)